MMMLCDEDTRVLVFAMLLGAGLLSGCADDADPGRAVQTGKPGAGAGQTVASGHGTLAPVVIPDGALPDAAIPAPVVPDQLVPDQLVPDQLVPDQLVPDQLVPDQLVPDQGTPDSGCGPCCATCDQDWMTCFSMCPDCGPNKAPCWSNCDATYGACVTACPCSGACPPSPARSRPNSKINPRSWPC